MQIIASIYGIFEPKTGVLKEVDMKSYDDKRRLSLLARGFAALCAALMLELIFSASMAEAAPFAYVTNHFSNSVSVIDTASNTVVATVPVGVIPLGLPLPPMGNTSMLRIRAPIPFRLSIPRPTRW
jgi:YVTN family beta-propeller protein